MHVIVPLLIVLIIVVKGVRAPRFFSNLFIFLCGIKILFLNFSYVLLYLLCIHLDISMHYVFMEQIKYDYQNFIISAFYLFLTLNNQCYFSILGPNIMRLIGNWVNLILRHATLPNITLSLAGVTLVWLLTQKRSITFKPKVR